MSKLSLLSKKSNRLSTLAVKRLSNLTSTNSMLLTDLLQFFHSRLTTPAELYLTKLPKMELLRVRLKLRKRRRKNLRKSPKRKINLSL